MTVDDLKAAVNNAFESHNAFTTLFINLTIWALCRVAKQRYILRMRPKAVTITTWLMALLNILGYALLWDLQKPRSVLIVVFVIFSVLIAIGYIVIWFYWRGENWARILVLLTSLLGLWNLRHLSPANVVVKAMIVGEAAVRLSFSTG